MNRPSPAAVAAIREALDGMARCAAAQAELRAAMQRSEAYLRQRILQDVCAEAETQAAILIARVR